MACLSETWFYDESNYQTAVLSNAGNFSVHNRPRITDTIGGGVSVLLKDNFKSVQLRKRGFSSFESLAILTTLSNRSSQKLKIISLYRKESVVFATFIDEISRYLQDLSLSKYPFIIAGDFNIQMNNRGHSYTKRFMKLCKDQNVCLNNIQDQKTHRAGNTIDFLICDNIADSIIVECTVDEHAPNISHHFPVIYKIQAVFNCRLTYVQRPRRSYRNFKLSDFKDDLQNKLAGLSSCDSFESKVKTFQSHLKACYDDHIPLKSSSIIYNQRPSWLDHEYVLQRALRRKLKRVFDRTGSTQDEINYNIQRTKCALLVGEKVDSKISKMIGESNGNTKALFNMYGKLVNNTASKCSQANLPEPDEHGGCLGLANKFNSFSWIKLRKPMSISAESLVPLPVRIMILYLIKMFSQMEPAISLTSDLVILGS